ncbi:hypothetical protein M433DRAFT_115939 [Acidomyces richmondensis BFW]|nr:MAG: hypothetical protein FE78DRAFT_162663 [Acidomyces sp. 'richmondensis']KYG41235.1 hypothetical protein M433DRAFT_115939 [Acidomyces richmondensis BFW]
MNITPNISAVRRVALQNAFRTYHAPIRLHALHSPRLIQPSLLNAPSLAIPLLLPPQYRHKSTSSNTSSPRPLTDAPQNSTPPQTDRPPQPSYELHFTCRKCLHRSAHRITKQAYHFGTTLVTCPGCKSRHLISDHLRIFSDKGGTVEEVLREKGELLRKGRLGEDGDVEFYEDGTDVVDMTHPAVVREALLLEAREQRSPNGPNREESQGDGASGEAEKPEGEGCENKNKNDDAHPGCSFTLIKSRA